MERKTVHERECEWERVERETVLERVSGSVWSGRKKREREGEWNGWSGRQF